MMEENKSKKFSNHYVTPDYIFVPLALEFDLEMDVCCTKRENSKCNKFITAAENALHHNWNKGNVYCNPPYSDIMPWILKAEKEKKKHGTITVFLLPARTGAKWFHYVLELNWEIRFLRGRIKWPGVTNNYHVDSIIVITREPVRHIPHKGEFEYHLFNPG